MTLRNSKVGKSVLMLVFMAIIAVSFASGGNAYEIGEAQFTAVATQALTYLGYAITAGLTILVAIVGARHAWKFIRRFLG